jgi:hypothetical protein
MILLHKVFVPDNLDKMMSELRAVIASGWVGEGTEGAGLRASATTDRRLRQRYRP